MLNGYDDQNAVGKSNLQKHVTVSSTSNGNIIWPLAVRSCRPIDEYRTLDNAFDAAPLPARPTIVFSHITDDFSVFLLFRALHHHHMSSIFIWCYCLSCICFCFCFFFRVQTPFNPFAMVSFVRMFCRKIYR